MSSFATSIVTALGGIGIFLLGMMILTDGLRALAGDRLRGLLRRSTSSPVKGAAAAAATTALVQSSSATTVVAVGFVGAGLITFQQALGIVFGANLGTTMTGWLVALLGFKLKLGVVLLPAVLLGVLFKLFARGPLRAAGWALAGFGVLFAGIDLLQQGMSAFQGVVTPRDFPADSFAGRLQLLAMGLAITLVTQSSSAGVAAALAALGAGALTLPQAAAMVIGMDIGTSFSAALATIGGSTAARRTGYAHVIYNLLTGIMALLLLTPFMQASAWLARLSGWSDPQLSLIAFHTAFNIVGVIAVIAFTGQFARLIIWLVPQRGPLWTDRLDDRLLSSSAVAVEAVLATIADITRSLFALLAAQLYAPSRGPDEGRLAPIDLAEDATRQFAERIRTRPGDGSTHARHVAAFHTLDHLARLRHRCAQRERLKTIGEDHVLSLLAREFGAVVRDLAGSDGADWEEEEVNRLRRKLREQRHSYRRATIYMASIGEIDAQTAMRRLDAVRWLHRTAYHVWRIVHHDKAIHEGKTSALQRAEPLIEVEDD